MTGLSRTTINGRTAINGSPSINGPCTPIPLGVYRGAAVDIGPIRDYEKNFLDVATGTAVSYVLAFLPDDPVTWPQFEQAALAASTNGPPGTETATTWTPILDGQTLMLAVPACCLGTTWADEAAGVNDAHWTALATTLVNGGLGHCVLRIAREFNGSWYPWQVTSENAAAYQAGYAHIVQTMRAAGFAGAFMWNPYLGRGTFAAFSPPTGVESVYPLADGPSGTDTIVDLIGLDVYDGPDPVNYPSGEVIRTPAQQQAAWHGMLTQRDGLTGWRSLAVDHGKPLCYPEWGLRLWNDNYVYQGGGDNPIFILEMAAWLKNTQAHMHAFWEDPGMGVADPDDLPRRLVAAPNARSAFLGQFGYH